MKTHQTYTLLAVLFLVSGTVHAQVTQIMPGVSVDLDTIELTPEMHWIVDSTCIAIEVKDHEELLAKYENMPDRYFVNLNKRLNTTYTREGLVAYEKQKIAEAKEKFPIYRKIFKDSKLASGK